MPSNVKTGPQPPSHLPNAGIEDVQAQFASLTAKTPVDNNFRTAFMKSKMRLAHTHPAVDLAARDHAVKSVMNALGPEASDLFGQPIPGGVGEGFFYTSAFKTGWGHGTSFAFDIVCPTPPGGNISTYLYLTATNRSGLGVEAFLSYDGQNDTHFRVYDWARTSAPWQTDIPLSGLGNYLRTDSAHGHPYQALPVWNSTWRINSTSYRNQALLYNHVRGGWDLVYQYDYAATDTQQKTGWVGSWSAIVETFQPMYNHTNPVGALTIQLISADNSGHWGSWALLAASNATVRNDNVGFHVAFLDADYAFTVTS